MARLGADWTLFAYHPVIPAKAGIQRPTKIDA